MPQSEAVLAIDTSLVGVVEQMTYARNHHWLKLRDHQGREIVLVENAVMRYVCTTCQFAMTCEENIGDGRPCPKCLKPMNGVWMRPQVALIPEQESDFVMPHRHNADKRSDEMTAMADPPKVI